MRLAFSSSGNVQGLISLSTLFMASQFAKGKTGFHSPQAPAGATTGGGKDANRLQRSPLQVSEIYVRISPADKCDSHSSPARRIDRTSISCSIDEEAVSLLLVSVASFNDPELLATLRNTNSHAAHPEQL